MQTECSWRGTLCCIILLINALALTIICLGWFGQLTTQETTDWIRHLAYEFGYWKSGTELQQQGYELIKSVCGLAERPYQYQQYAFPEKVNYNDIVKPFDDYSKQVPYQLFDDRIEFDPSPRVPYQSRSTEPLETIDAEQQLKNYLSHKNSFTNPSRSIFAHSLHDEEFEFKPKNISTNYNDINVNANGISGMIYDEKLSNMHPFVTSALLAWSNHYPLIIKPSHIWLLILQRVATHVAENSDQLKPKWIRQEFMNVYNSDRIQLKFQSTINHAGYAETICKDDFSSQECQNEIANVNWNVEFSSGIEAFVEGIKQYTYEDVSTLIDFNLNWTQSERVAFYATMMKVVEKWFMYSILSVLCGFPRITLYGTKSDWILLKSNMIDILDSKCTKKFGEVMKPAWVAILDQFINVFDGNIDSLFWNSMVKRADQPLAGCGPSEPYVSGWINNFFDTNPIPYDPKQDYVWQWVGIHHNSSRKLDTFPSGIYDIDIDHFILNDTKLHSGFVGMRHNQRDLSIEPIIGWYVCLCINYWYLMTNCV